MWNHSLVLRSSLKLLCPMKVKLYYVPPFHQNSFTIIYVSCNYQKRSAARGYIFLDFYTRYANRKLGCAFKTFAFNSLHVDDFERLSMNQNLFSNIICQVKKPTGVLVSTSTEILTLFSQYSINFKTINYSLIITK